MTWYYCMDRNLLVFSVEILNWLGVGVLAEKNSFFVC